MSRSTFQMHAYLTEFSGCNSHSISSQDRTKSPTVHKPHVHRASIVPSTLSHLQYANRKSQSFVAQQTQGPARHHTLHLTAATTPATLAMSYAQPTDNLNGRRASVAIPMANNDMTQMPQEPDPELRSQINGALLQEGHVDR